MLNTQGDTKFTGEEVTTFKRFLEENDITTDNIFRNIEENLDYYSKRLSSNQYFSPAELFWVNSFFFPSNEMMKNIKLYHRSIKWRYQTVHPNDSESVQSEEKYQYRSSISSRINCVLNFIDQNLSDNISSCLDLYLFCKNDIIQYLPHKNFVFRYQQNALKMREALQKVLDIDDSNLDSDIIIIPVFIPIRETMFLGEYGFRNSLINYGKFLNVLSSMNKGNIDEKSLINSHYLNEAFHLDGVEKSINSLFRVEAISIG